MAAEFVSQTEIFHDRAEAGRELAGEIERFRGSEAIVLGLARGGVPVAFEVASALRLPLDVFVVRKLGFPGQPELAMGAVASGGIRVLNEEVAAVVEPAQLEEVAASEAAEVERRERSYRGDRAPLEVAERIAILVDDGLATGASMLAAVHALRRGGAREVVVAVPVAPQETCEALAPEADEVICARTPRPFLAVGAWYENFGQTSDREVSELLERSPAAAPEARGDRRAGNGGQTPLG